ncbi:RNA-binding domain-containing protein [Clostridium beijerinckii]|uniref:AAA family ATPase n=1 Tax=Clostridium beijerinckii TaxID=1520 RepID=A0A1S9N3T0_CLOBE|nr:RNA-binding domain-containing protein [Clostridium beijerinckii]OOP72092.1 AAA family ATPase [Clostridium beijerinckii]
MTDIELLEILKIGETVDVECKEGENKIPNSLWESYSAMANTNGGIIILGIKENRAKGTFEVQGVKNIDKRIQDFWNTINGNKVNRNLLKDDDVEKLTIEGMDVLIINVPRANYKERPIYLNENPYKGTYKRNSEGDYKSTEEEVNAMIRDASEDGNDGVILEDYTVKDLDDDTIKKYRNRFSSRNPDHPWNALDNEEFIEMLGGIKEDRRRKIKGVTVAGMLMFGKGLYIRDLFAKINFDFREEMDVSSDQRWSDRFTIDGTWENNIYNFYFTVINKLTSNVKVPFRLENLERKDDTLVHQAIREAFVNQIIHADFNIQGTLKIIKTKDSLEFTNPGSLKIDLESIFKGGNSKSRNPRIQKMFSLIGLGEGAGSGFPKILSAWNEQNWRTPELKEEANLSQVSLKLWMISMLPEECLGSLKSIFGKAFNSFNKDEVLILATAYLEGSVNNARIQLMMDKHSYDITGILHDLVEKQTLMVDGYGRGKVYYLNNDYSYDYTSKMVDERSLNEDEIKIIDYIKKNGSINNQQGRDHLGFGKDKNVALFNSLIKKGKIRKEGASSSTRYLLN